MATETELSTYDLFIDGEAVPSVENERFETYNPATGEAFAQVARARKAERRQGGRCGARRASWLAFDPGRLTRKSIDITTAVEYDPWTLCDALQFLASTIDTYPYENLIDAEFPLSDIEEAFERSESRDLTRATLIPGE